MSPVTQHQCSSRPVATHYVARPRRCKRSVLPLAFKSPVGHSSPEPKAPHATLGWKFFRASVVATSLQFCAAASQVANASVGGGFGAGGGFSGSGGGGGGGGDGPSRSGPGSANVLGDAADASDLVEEIVLLDVGGMKCGGCVGHVKKILEAQPGVTSASVNLTTETALVRVLVPRSTGRGAAGGDGGAMLAVMGQKLAQVLIKEGFESRPRAEAAVAAR